MDINSFLMISKLVYKYFRTLLHKWVSFFIVVVPFIACSVAQVQIQRESFEVAYLFDLHVSQFGNLVTLTSENPEYKACKFFAQCCIPLSAVDGGQTKKGNPGKKWNLCGYIFEEIFTCVHMIFCDESSWFTRPHPWSWMSKCISFFWESNGWIKVRSRSELIINRIILRLRFNTWRHFAELHTTELPSYWSKC